MTRVEMAAFASSMDNAERVAEESWCKMDSSCGSGRNAGGLSGAAAECQVPERML